MATIDTARPLRQRDRVARTVLYVVLSVGLVAVVAPFVWMVRRRSSARAGCGRCHRRGGRRRSRSTIPASVRRLELRASTSSTRRSSRSSSRGQPDLLLAARLRARHARLPGKRLIFVVVLGTLMVPGVRDLRTAVRAVANAASSTRTRTHPALPRQPVRRLPHAAVHPSDCRRTSLDAARVDGAGELRHLRAGVLPLCRPALATLGILTFLASLEQLPLAARRRHLRGQVHAARRARALRARRQNRTDYRPAPRGRASSSSSRCSRLPHPPAALHRGIATTGLQVSSTPNLKRK